MNKEKILEKSKSSNKQEELTYIKNKGMNTGYLIFGILSGFLMFSNLMLGKTIYEIQILVWGFIAGISLEKYKMYKQKQTLIALVSSSIATITFLITYILASIYGW